MERSSLEETLLDNLFRSLVVMISHPIATLNPINSIASLKFLALADIANLQFAIEVTAILFFSVGATAFMNRCMHGLVWNYLSLASLHLRMICCFGVRWYFNMYVNCGLQILSTPQAILMIPRSGDTYTVELP